MAKIIFVQKIRKSSCNLVMTRELNHCILIENFCFMDGRKLDNFDSKRQIQRE